MFLRVKDKRKIFSCLSTRKSSALSVCVFMLFVMSGTATSGESASANDVRRKKGNRHVAWAGGRALLRIVSAKLKRSALKHQRSMFLISVVRHYSAKLKRHVVRHQRWTTSVLSRAVTSDTIVLSFFWAPQQCQAQRCRCAHRSDTDKPLLDWKNLLHLHNMAEAFAGSEKIFILLRSLLPMKHKKQFISVGACA